MKIAGIELKNPTILASGIMGTTGAALARMGRNGAGAVVTKSIGPVPRKGHNNPSMVELECGYINAMGLPNPSYPGFCEEIKIAKSKMDAPLIASIFGGDAGEFTEVAKGLLSSKPDCFELNVSCPHAEGYGASVGTDPELVHEITASVVDAVDVPVWVKLTPNVTDITPIGRAAESAGASAVVAINTVRGMAIDIHSGYPILGNRFGGLSGPAVKPVAVKCVYDLYEALDIPVIGVGGITCPEDAIEMILAGARAVEIGSAVHDDVQIFEKISKGIDIYLQKYGYSKTEDITGLSHEMI
jgi:dihydroorotate dehydrogenase (NAD+) catalytic subunit